MIVVDRALYTWYRGDRRDEEITVATAASKTLVIASMKVGVFVVIHRAFGPTVWVGWFGWTCLFVDFFLWRKLGGEENVGGCDFVDVIFLDSKNKVQVFGTWLFIKDLNLKDCGERGVNRNRRIQLGELSLCHPFDSFDGSLGAGNIC